MYHILLSKYVVIIFDRYTHSCLLNAMFKDADVLSRQVHCGICQEIGAIAASGRPTLVACVHDTCQLNVPLYAAYIYTILF